MILEIKEYLYQLKESGELDIVLPDLLVNMGFKLLSTPQKGIKQDGVDVAAFGHLPDKEDQVFLFTIKRADISRVDWSVGVQAVRPSLEEILDKYIPNKIPVQYKDYHVNIILVSGGEIKQNLNEDWVGFTNRYTDEKISFDFWGGDKISQFLLTFMINEYLFNDECRSNFRKTLALIDEPEDGYKYWQKVVYELYKLNNRKTSNKKLQKSVSSLNLALRILYAWSKETNNLKLALLASEYAVLITWDNIKERKLFTTKKFTLLGEMFFKMLDSYDLIITEHYEKIKKYCQTKDGFERGISNSLDYNLLIQDVLGELGMYLNYNIFKYSIISDESNQKKLQEIITTISGFIKSNSILFTPLYDRHIIEFGILFIGLYKVRANTLISFCLNEITSRINFAYKTEEPFLIDSDSYELAVEVALNGLNKEETSKISTFIPILAEWCLIVKNDFAYNLLLKNIETNFNNTDLQMWFPDENTENYLFRQFSAKETGSCYHSIKLPEKLEDLQNDITDVNKHLFEAKQISCFKFGDLDFLGLLASKHFKNPVIPYYWHRYLETDVAEEQNQK